MLREETCDELHLVCDRYDGLHGVLDPHGKSVSLKDAGGCRECRMESQREYQVNTGHAIKHWDEIVGNSRSKALLLEFSFEYWSTHSNILPGDLTLTLGGGF